MFSRGKGQKATDMDKQHKDYTIVKVGWLTLVPDISFY